MFLIRNKGAKEVTLLWQYNHTDELRHYGVLGMKWGVRRGRQLTVARQLKSDRKTLDELNKGRHMSIGFTKKRQAMYDKIDKQIMTEHIQKQEQYLQKKAEKKSFKDDVKTFKTKGLKFDTEHVEQIGADIVSQWYNSKGQKVGQEYVNKVMKQAEKEQVVKQLAGTAAVIIGTRIAAEMLIKNK